jgi:type III secretory pathway lipoprotein EscJ
MVLRGALLAVGIAACAPELATPADRQRATDRDDADRIAAAVAGIPGVVAAHAAVQHDVADPLAARPRPLAPPRAAVAVVVAADVDEAALVATARALAGASGVAPARVEVAVARAPAPATGAYAQVGPFTVAARSAAALRATLVALLVAIAAAAGVVAVGQRRRGNRPQ